MNIILAKASTTPGTLSVSASSVGLTAGSATVTMTVIGGTSVLPYDKKVEQALPVRAIYSFRMAGDRFYVPKQLTGKAVSIALYDLSGKLIGTTSAKMGDAVDIRKTFGTKTGIHIVRIKS
jgi:hypothetical protein